MQASRTLCVETIVRSLVGLAHALCMDVVAEGAETEEEMAMLRGMHCDVVQGFGYGRPLTFDTFVSFVSQRNSVGAHPGVRCLDPPQEWGTPAAARACQP
ncbi:EAL domain-containing protein [Sphaerotilus sp.]|jgi:diguanylate cyclase|uniref:EAL domain-containing protein n=1 Tax=Sphaerotilus sp. TaxID=2093942 RepID=UPI0025E3C2D4|nr:EAL domain-containing protein [Sphaerotilus sp.]